MINDLTRNYGCEYSECSYVTFTVRGKTAIANVPFSLVSPFVLLTFRQLSGSANKLTRLFSWYNNFIILKEMKHYSY